MNFIIIAIICISVAPILYKIAVSLFSEGYVRFFSTCYLVAIWLFIIFLMVPYFFPSMIGYETWGYFLVYAPLFALFLLFPAMLSVAIAHIACKIKYRNNKDSAGTTGKLSRIAIIFFPISFLLSVFIFPLFYITGILLVVIVSIRKTVSFISQKVKQRTALFATEKKKIIIAVCSIFIFCSPVLLVGSGFLGRPIESSFVNRGVQAYVALHYSELDLRVGRTRRGFMDRSYTTRIYYRNNDEIFFNINYSSRGGITDNYTRGSFWAGRLRIAHSLFVEERFGEKLRRFDVSVHGLQAGEMPAQSANLAVWARMELVLENQNSSTIAESFLQFKEIFRYSEIPVMNYRIEFFLPDDRLRTTVVELHARHINEDLPALIEYLQNNLGVHGSYVDRERGTSYWSFANE